MNSKVKGCLRVHKETVHDKLRVECSICNKSMTKSSLVVHMKSTHENRKYPCKICTNEFTRQCNLTRHMKAIHGDKIKVKYETCDAEYSTKEGLYSHIKTKHFGIDHRCNQSM